MSSFATSLVRRGFEAHGSMITEGDDTTYNIPTWGALILGLTAVSYLGFMFMIEYTFGRILPTLLMIESPQDAILFEPLHPDNVDSTTNKDPETAQVRLQPITASFRRTVKHLQAIGGFRARFRGIVLYAISTSAVNALAGTLSALPLLSFIPRPVWHIAAVVLCAPLPLAWTHIVISKPSPKTWFQRLPTLKTAKKIAGPLAIYALAQQLAVYLPAYFAIVSGVTDNPAGLTSGKRTAVAFKGFGFLLLSLILCFLAVLPAHVTLTRVSASLLADTEETIVPFDRSFGGKVVPEIVGGNGVIGMLDAWKSFDWASRVRLVKVYVKMFALQVAVSIFFILILVAQLFMIVGQDWSKLIPKDGDKQLKCNGSSAYLARSDLLGEII